MQNKKIFILKLVFAFILLVCVNKTYAQVTANPTQGCAPLVGVQFTGVNGATNIQWNFGDGSFANINTPTHTFTNSGTYNVTYTATVSGSNVNHNVSVVVHGKPTPNFNLTIPPSHCAPMAVSFNDNSTGGGGSAITSWQWAFGDGGVSALENPNYSYTIGGIFDVTLTVRDINGCDSSTTLNNQIIVSLVPNVVITNTPASLNACSVPFNVSFNGASSTPFCPIGGGLTYNWNLGNGQTSNLATPTATTYTNTGTYTLTLTCTDSNSCSQTVTRNISILNTQSQIFAQDTVCLNSTWIATDSSKAIFSTWNYGDGTTNGSTVVGASSGGDTIHHIFTSPGFHQIILTSFNGSCVDTDTFNLFVEQSIANFTSTSPSFGCSSPYTTVYTNTSTNAVSYSWVFDNDSTSTLANPIVSYNQNSLNEYTIFEENPLSATLFTTSIFGCRDSITKTLDTLHRPTAYFYTNEREGCIPLSITFTDSSFSHFDSQDITNYEWHFGDGSATISGPNDTIVSHTYTTEGDYFAYLVIQTISGCSDTSFFFPVEAAVPPAIVFSASPTSICPNDPVVITNTTNPADSVDHWHIIADGWSFSHCIDNANPDVYYTHTGVQTITMEGYTNGCMGTSTFATPITVNGPIVTARYFTQCGDSAYKVKFEATLQDAESATFDFGDGSPAEIITGSGTFNFEHTYNASGNYTAIVLATNSITGCAPYSDTLTVVVRKAKAVITLPSGIVCENISSVYSAAASIDVFATNNVGYTWFFGNLPPIMTSNSTVTNPLPMGNYPITLIVKDENECRDTTTSFIKASGVDALFTLPSSIGCLPEFEVNPVNTSTSDTTIVNYIWNYGDGSGNSQGTLPLPPHTYSVATSPSQSYTISLTAINANTCTNTYTTSITVNAPAPSIAATSNTNICAGSSVNFSSGNVANVSTYAWNFGDGILDSTTTSITNHVYNNGGIFSTSVSIIDINGCIGYSSNVPVIVQAIPQAGFSITNMCDTLSLAVCAGCNIVFTDTSVNSSPQPRVWNLGTGAPVVGNESVGTTYGTEGLYTITLISTSSFGCKDTIIDTIEVLGAHADFSTSVSTICKGESITFNINNDSSNVFTWLWDFGDGSDTSFISPIPHAFNYHPPGGVNNVTLVYWTKDSACRYSVQHPINIRQVIANFNRNNELIKSDTAHCIGISDLFTNTSSNANTYGWNFGDGQTSNSFSPSHTFATADTFMVTLNISDSQFGCKDTIEKEIIIFSLPVATLQGANICFGDSAQITPSGDPTYSYVWHPGNLLIDSTATNPIAIVGTTTTFTVEVIDLNACRDTFTANVNIQQPPISIDWDTTVIIGQLIPIPGYAGPTNIYNYNWTPTTDLNCTTCPNPTSSSLVDIVYLSDVSDTSGCFSIQNKFTITIIPKSTVDVPTAFTPNGDGENDIVFVKGWGIKKLNYFKIYNRWGQLVFESNDINVGWNGTFQGVLQNMETYVYQVSVVTYTDVEDIIKKGTVKLIR